MKKLIIIFFITSIFIFISAEPWEGSAVIAPQGELPVTGYYVATDSFPGNTVVDITNIENGKKTRVMVANRLNNPDLLAIVSRQAAELIGMETGFVTNIRMVQVTEPFASMNLSRRLADGMPEYDSGSVLAGEFYSEDTYRPVSVPAHETPVAMPPSYTLEPEWRTRDVIVDLFPYSDTKPAAEVLPEKKAEEVKEPKEIIIVEEIIEEPVEIVKVEEIKEPEKIVEETAEKPEEIVEAKKEESTLVLVPAEERPPESLYGINPADIIPGLKLPEPEWQPGALVEAPPPVQPKAPPVQAFSVPRITELNRGWYYVQIAAFDTPQSVENALRQIDLHYQPVIYKESDPWYRIMLGPLNQGESAAILQRFKSIGYRDAFVRHVR